VPCGSRLPILLSIIKHLFEREPSQKVKLHFNLHPLLLPFFLESISEMVSNLVYFELYTFLLLFSKVNYCL